MHYMKIIVLLIFLLLIGVTAVVAQKNSKKEVVGKTEDRDFYELPWFSKEYAIYSSDTASVRELKDRQENYTFILFAGAWCGDTRNLLPKFYKTIDVAGISHGKITTYFLNTRKKSPERLERQYNVTAIPVFIILKDNKEVGRIVETINEPIEKELVQIMR